MRPIIAFAFAAMMSLVIPLHAATDLAAPSEEAASATNAGVVEAEETLRGTIAAVDERNDKVSVRLSPDETTDMKVVDGLLFNALRYGDAVRVTVKTVGGVKDDRRPGRGMTAIDRGTFPIA